MGDQGFRLGQGAEYYESLCKVDENILSGLEKEIERMELSLMDSKR